MIRLALLSLAFASSVIAQTQPTTAPAGTWTGDAFGRRVLRPFASAPYPHPSRASGFTNAAGDHFGPEHYADTTVGLFVPAGYTPGDAVDYVVHFHGHRNHVANVFEKFKLEEEVVKSGVNAILIVPQGPLDVPDSGGGKLELDDNGFKNLIDEVTTYLNAEHVIHTTTVGQIVLSAHSGGYKVCASVLHRGGLTDHITDVLLFDASYGNLDWFADFVAMHADARLVSFHTKHLDAANVQLKALVEKMNSPTHETNERDLAGIARDFVIGQRGATFISTTLAHDDVPSGKDYLTLMLSTSSLDKPTTAPVVRY